MRSKTKVKEVVGSIKDSNDQFVSDNRVMCQILNEYFCSVFTSETVNNALPEVKYMFDKDSNHMLSNIELSQDTIASKLSKLKANKVSGVDGIVPRILIENADLLSLPLLHIFKKSLESSIVPSDWKKANVTAIIKKGDKSSTPGALLALSLLSLDAIVSCDSSILLSM